MRRLVCFLLVLLMVFVFSAGPVAALDEDELLGDVDEIPEGFNPLMNFLRWVFVTIMNIASLVFGAMFAIRGFAIGASSSNPVGRANQITALVFTGLGAIVCFGAAVWVGIFKSIVPIISP